MVWNSVRETNTKGNLMEKDLKKMDFYARQKYFEDKYQTNNRLTLQKSLTTTKLVRAATKMELVNEIERLTNRNGFMPLLHCSRQCLIWLVEDLQKKKE